MKTSQQGFAHLLLIVVLVIGIFASVLLVLSRTSFKSRATDYTRIEITGRTDLPGSIDSRIVAIKPIFTSDSNTASAYRISNDPTQFDKSNIYPYTSESSQSGIVWNLSSGLGQKSIYAQFLVNGTWTKTPLLATVALNQPPNPYNLQIICQTAPASILPENKISMSWDKTRLEPQVASLTLRVFGQDGKIYDLEKHIAPTTSTFELKLPANQSTYNVFLGATKLKIITTPQGRKDITLAPVNSSEAITTCN